MLRRSSGHHPLLAGALRECRLGVRAGRCEVASPGVLHLVQPPSAGLPCIPAALGGWHLIPAPSLAALSAPAGVLAEEDPKNRELMARQENGLQQLVRGWTTWQGMQDGQALGAHANNAHVPGYALSSRHLPPAFRPAQVLMALSDNPTVVGETCRTLTLLAEHSPSLADAVVENDAIAIMRLLPAVDEARQLSSLGLLAAIAYSSPAASARIATPQLLDSLQQLVGVAAGNESSTTGGGTGGSSAAVAAGGSGRSDAAAAAAQPGEEVRTAALKALGNLAFCPDNRRRLSRTPELMARLSALALRQEGPPRMQVSCGCAPDRGPQSASFCAMLERGNLFGPGCLRAVMSCRWRLCVCWRCLGRTSWFGERWGGRPSRGAGCASSPWVSRRTWGRLLCLREQRRALLACPEHRLGAKHVLRGVVRTVQQGCAPAAANVQMAGA